MNPDLKLLFEKGYTPEKIRRLQAQGRDISTLAKFEMGYTPEDIRREKARSEEGFFASTARAIVTPVAKIVARPIQAIGALRGQSADEIDATTKRVAPYFGNDLKSPRTSADVVKDVGAAAETVSLGIGGVGTVGAVKTGLKGLITAGVKEGSEIGVKSGALMGFGQGLEIASEQPPEEAFKTVFGSTALGAGLGLATGVIGGAVTPIAVKGVTGASKFFKVPELEIKLADGYKRILNPTSRQLKIEKRFGTDSFKFLSEEMPDLPLQVNKDGRIVADDAIEMAKQKYTAEAAAYKPIIRNSGKYTNVDDVIAKAKRAAREELDGTDLLKAEQQIEYEVNSFLTNHPQDVNVTANGERFVTLARADDIKTYSWSRGKGWGTPEAEVWNDTNNIIGHAFKDAIEKELPSAPIKAMNRRLGQWKNAIDMLERKNGLPTGTGGKLTKLFSRQTGTLVGAGLGLGNDGGIGGTVGGATTGFLTANALAAIFANPSVRLFVVRQLIRNLKKAGKTDMIEEAQRILQEEASKYLLPAAGKSSYVERPILSVPKGLEYVGGEKAITIAPDTFPKQPSTKKGVMEKEYKRVQNLPEEYVPPSKLPVIQQGKKPVSKYKQESDLPVIR